MSASNFPTPPVPDVPTQPHPLPKPTDPGTLPPDVNPPQPGTVPEQPAVPYPVNPPQPPPPEPTSRRPTIEPFDVPFPACDNPRGYPPRGVS